jgi:hypothetical protein
MTRVCERADRGRSGKSARLESSDSSLPWPLGYVGRSCMGELRGPGLSAGSLVIAGLSPRAGGPRPRLQSRRVPSDAAGNRSRTASQ